MIFYEFKELLLELANTVSKASGTWVAGKPRTVLKKFLDESFLLRLAPFVQLYQKKQSAGGVTRTWPESEKDRKIREIMEERARIEAEEQARLAEEAAARAEMAEVAEVEQVDEGPTAEELAAAEEEARLAAQAEATKKESEGEEDEASAVVDDYDDEDLSDA